MASVLLSKDQERQARWLRFEPIYEREYQDLVASDRIGRIRIVTVLLVVLMFLGPPIGKSDPLWLTLIVNAPPIIILALVFIPKFKRLAIYALPVWSWLQLIAFGFTVKVAVPWMQVTIDLSLAILIISAVRAPAILSLIYVLTTFGFRYYRWISSGTSKLDLQGPSLFLLFGFFFLSIGAWLTEIADRRSFLIAKALEEEREKTQNLLANVLPPEIAEKLKNNSEAIAEHHESVTILFADVANFTPFSSGKTPAEVVGFLNQLFSRWDSAVEKCGLTKIKTVGDAYMVGAGLPQFRQDHAVAMADLALEMRGVASALGAEVRFGIHTGSVVAGVIGTQRYTYDVWGATVNMAARLQTAASVGEILVSRSTAEAIAHSHDLGEIVSIDLKGIGEVPVQTLMRRSLEPVRLSNI